jgi:cell division protein ZapA
MAQVEVTINGRSYTVACAAGEEAHVGRLAAYVEQKVETLVQSVGQAGDARLLLMASLLIADELAEAEQALDRAEQGLQPAEPSVSRLAAAEELAAARTIDQLALRLEAIAVRLERD